ncbi:MAG: RND family efflux transporter MFP subunit [Myxococcota bacterium]
MIMRWIILFLTLSGCASAPASVYVSEVPRVLADSVEHVVVPGGVLHGVTRSVDEGQLGFVGSGRLLHLMVQPGDVVESGQILAELDATATRARLAGVDAQIARAQAAQDLAASDRRRGEALATTASLSLADLDGLATADVTSGATVDALLAQRSELRWMLGENTLRAPYGGSIAATYADAGEVVAAGSPVVSLRATDALEVRVAVPEAWVADVLVGDGVDLHFPLAGVPSRRGQIVRLSDAADVSGLFPAIVAVEGSDLRAGFTTEVVLPPSDVDALSVPAAAIVSPSGERTRVRLVRDERIVEVDVDVVGASTDGLIVEGPLTAGDAVVIAGHSGLVDGATVRVMR